MSRTGRSRALVVAAVAALALAACGGSGGSGGGGGSASGGSAPPLPAVPSMSSLGQGEGQLNLVNWAGYAEDGSNDPSVDWVHPFEQATGCKVNDKIGNTSDEMVQLMKTGQYDGVSASGDATLRLIYGGLVAPVNTSLVPNYATIQPFLKDRAWNSVDGKMYGIPHGWGANLLLYRPDVVNPAPTSWGSVFSASSPYAGKITAYDSPIYIADAALYLMKTQPQLGIKDPYALDAKQLDAAVTLLKQQRKQVGEYWSDYTKAVQSVESGGTVLGTTWQVIANLVKSDGKVPVATVLPGEGATGWSDTWMVAAKAAHPVCMYKWMDWITSPKVNAQVAEWFGEAPAQSKSCSLTSDPTFCDTYHANDAAFADKISYWTTPTTHCLDGRGNICTDYATWTQKWTEVKG
jgi:putative spermidine/putrescine transport system substrate-binding protein